VQQIYFRPGETAPPGRPVLSLLPPGNLKVRFFAPETRLATIRYGETVKVSCDGCGTDIDAKITFIASSAEYTPPVIYSREERAKLVYMIEARPTDPDKLRVGQPVTVTLSEGQSQ
jgi:HlyD family secretion protein